MRIDTLYTDTGHSLGLRLREGGREDVQSNSSDRTPQYSDVEFHSTHILLNASQGRVLYAPPSPSELRKSSLGFDPDVMLPI